MRIAFVGLGAMGRPMAANLAGRFDIQVWNRTGTVATEHAAAHGSTAVDALDDLDDVEVVCSCLPTTVEVAAVARQLVPRLDAGTVWLDHTSGDPQQARDLAAELAGQGIDYLDAPVSGGTAGAAAGSLTVMVGGDAEALEQVTDVLDAVADRVVHVGPSGAGMAVKAVNNALLAAALWASAEGFAALEQAGVPTSVALEVVNASSGRSNATEQLFPERVVTREFPNTFALGLLAKDVGLARATLDGAGVEGPVLHLVDRLTTDAADALGSDVDHTELVRMVERATGVELR
ncbi:NAD(P)-dependent oxidoreductase [Egicoccus halophilus]|uniref:3-hydroxyisobutyrate dehydrogenase n=1 Tax=Egicoccus halophilus TaxID=1670830 RepID=A0A8J3EQT5_9ACTN|nr:NAD(P)-dependent oxidoreductase [Egicoccus halophilus]GGI03323.1 3-hydroxyisobutyrate dehydrogenase [Egicoccus halophilus]